MPIFQLHVAMQNAVTKMSNPNSIQRHGGVLPQVAACRQAGGEAEGLHVMLLLR